MEETDQLPHQVDGEEADDHPLWTGMERGVGLGRGRSPRGEAGWRGGVWEGLDLPG